MKTATVTVVATLVLASSAIVAVAHHAPLTHGAAGDGAPAHRGGPAHGVPVIDRTAAHGEELHPAAEVGHAPVHVPVVASPPLTLFALQPAAKTGHDGAPAQPEPAPSGAQARKMSVDEESATKERSSTKRSAKKRSSKKRPSKKRPSKRRPSKQRPSKTHPSSNRPSKKPARRDQRRQDQRRRDQRRRNQRRREQRRRDRRRQQSRRRQRRRREQRRRDQRRREQRRRDQQRLNPPLPVGGQPVVQPAMCGLGQASVEVVGGSVVAVWNGLRCALGAVSRIGSARVGNDDAEQVVVCAMDGFLYATLVTEQGRVSCILTEGVQR